MNRRALLGGLSGLLATAGCVGQLTPWSSPIEHRELTAYDPSEDFYDEAPKVRDPPKITFTEAKTQVRVTGKLFVGSSTCGKAVLKEASYERDGDTLRVTVGSGDKEHDGDYCTADESADAYRAIITFKEQLPQTVVAIQKDDGGDNKTTAHYPMTNT